MPDTVKRERVVNCIFPVANGKNRQLKGRRKDASGYAVKDDYILVILERFN